MMQAVLLSILLSGPVAVRVTSAGSLLPASPSTATSPPTGGWSLTSLDLAQNDSFLVMVTVPAGGEPLVVEQVAAVHARLAVGAGHWALPGSSQEGSDIVLLLAQLLDVPAATIAVSNATSGNVAGQSR